jgi:hypothetical protein|tara:strand:- start:92 stop:562 length:471 start_codon:yes stop_codon:yes gene_type:complete
MYKKNYNNNDFETHKLEVTLVHNKGKWDYKSMPKVIMYDTTTKKKYSPYQFEQWLQSSHIRGMIEKGANLKIATYDYDDTPNGKYDDGNRRKLIFYFSALKNPPAKPIDGLKHISQSVPNYKEVPMTEAQPSAPDHAVPVEKMSDMDDDLPEETPF